MNDNKLFKYLAIPLVMILVCMTFFTPIPSTLKLIIRIFFLILFFSLWRYFIKRGNTKTKDLCFAYFTLNLAFLAAMPFTSEFWNLDQHTSKGIALIKLNDSLIISIILIISFFIARYDLKSIFLAKGKLVTGIVTGIIFFVLFGYLALNNPQQKPEPEFIRKNLFWILMFVLSNGFMEELIFRGVLLGQLNKFFKPVWSIILTSFCFAAPHLTVIYQPDVIKFFGICFILGLICGYAMYYTRSIIAPALIHAGADLMIIIPIFTSFGAIQ
jgi:membrane protease YdiL (CAAX protease family)